MIRISTRNPDEAGWRACDGCTPTPPMRDERIQAIRDLRPEQMPAVRAELIAHGITPTGNDLGDATRWVALQERLLQDSTRH